MEGGDKLSPTGCVLQYEEVGHEKVVRELAQNALDAAREAKRTCDLRFEVRNVPTDSLPGIATYRDHLAEEGMSEWKERGQGKYDTILRRLRELSKQASTECLMVYDNGIGLNAETMEGLIGKGDTMKREDDGGSGGTHGVGHETAFAAGDMHYVIYGGVHGNGINRRVASGHVVFPTHIREQRRYGGHGYLSSDVGQLTLSGVSIIDNSNQIPSLVNKELDGIEASSGSGSVVIIPAFNRFPKAGGLSSEDCCELICEDIAKHFFVAIAQDRLTLNVKDCSSKRGGGEAYLLNSADDVERRLARDSIRNQKRRRSGTVLVAGHNIYEAWRTYQDGEEHSLDTSFGSVTVRIRYTPDQTTRLCIVRAGMFITDDSRLLARRYFTAKQPFSAVLLFANDPVNSTWADNILRAAEDAGHTDITDVMRSGDGSKIEDLFEEVRDALNKVLKDVKATKTHDPDIIPIHIHANRATSPNPGTKPRQVKRRSSKPGEGPSIGPGRTKKGKRRGRKRGQRPYRRRLSVRTTVVPVGPTRYEVEVSTAADAKVRKNVLFHLETKTGSDETCDIPLRNEKVKLDPAGCRVNGKPVPTSETNYIKLGTLEPNSRVRLSLEVKQTHGPLEAALYEGEQP